MKLLCIGGKGFIGRALVERLQAEGHDVSTYDAIDGQDILDMESLEKAILKVEAVFHLAAVADLNWARVHSYKTMQINVKGTYNVAYLCSRNHKKLYYASTCCVYGNQPKHPVDETTLPNPAEIYACTKLAGEYVVKGYAKMYGLQYNNMRFATIYGPGMRPALGVHIFFRQAIKGLDITVHGDGEQTRTLTYIDDLIDGIVALFNKGIFGEDINLTAEAEISANEMAELIKGMTESESKIVHIEQRKGQTIKEQVSAEKAKKLLGWEAKTSFVEGLKKTYKWFEETNQESNIYVMPT